MTDADNEQRRFARIETLFDDGASADRPAGWRAPFLETLAETSNVAISAELAGISASLAYRVRRQDAAFASEWRKALVEGYEHLEMETLHRLRMGTPKDEPKFDIGAALRILALHRETIALERSGRPDRDEEAILASIDAKLARIRSREKNVTRMLSEEGVNAPRCPGVDE